MSRRELPEAGKAGPVEFCLSGGGGAGRFGRIRVCGTTAAAREGIREEKESRGTRNVTVEVSRNNSQRSSEWKERCWCLSAHL